MSKEIVGFVAFLVLVASVAVVGVIAMWDWQEDRCAAVGAKRAGNGTSLCVTRDGRIVAP